MNMLSNSVTMISIFPATLKSGNIVIVTHTHTKTHAYILVSRACCYRNRTTLFNNH